MRYIKNRMANFLNNPTVKAIMFIIYIALVCGTTVVWCNLFYIAAKTALPLHMLKTIPYAEIFFSGGILTLFVIALPIAYSKVCEYAKVNNKWKW